MMSRTWILIVSILLVGACVLPRAGTGKKDGSENPEVLSARISSIAALDKELGNVKSGRVVISTRLLRTIVANELIYQKHCKDVSGQLEAIKNVDIESAGAGE